MQNHRGLGGNINLVVDVVECDIPNFKAVFSFQPKRVYLQNRSQRWGGVGVVHYNLVSDVVWCKIQNFKAICQLKRVFANSEGQGRGLFINLVLDVVRCDIPIFKAVCQLKRVFAKS